MLTTTMQPFADAFDGVVVSVPAWDLKEQLVNQMNAAYANLRADGTEILQAPQWRDLTAAAMDICDTMGNPSYNPKASVISIDNC